MASAVSENPFGRSITTEDIVDTLGFFDSWEDRYKYIIDLGKELPAMPDELKTEDRLIRGCQSQVWLEPSEQDGYFEFQADSDAFIVKGLLGVILSAYNHKRAGEILDFDIDSYFDELDLMRHLSPTRGNGLRAMVQRIREIAGE
ncbi:SufE family protein [Spongiibacter nanhainus]|uniref:SufE family protein n=1 Tax=Spongiibacter nanhainus TaxID=2794344 RepID=A0A7T4QYH5_9GAMM|nr:SufE family protein [Spongiibacter nanhainus]QQD17125.1 SufE family protein [Spongiibacter nanhainus]